MKKILLILNVLILITLLTSCAIVEVGVRFEMGISTTYSTLDEKVRKLADIHDRYGSKYLLFDDYLQYEKKLLDEYSKDLSEYRIKDDTSFITINDVIKYNLDQNVNSFKIAKMSISPMIASVRDSVYDAKYIDMFIDLIDYPFILMENYSKEFMTEGYYDIMPNRTTWSIIIFF